MPVQAMDGRVPHPNSNSSAPKFPTTTITNWIDGGKLSILQVQKHIDYLDKSAPCMPHVLSCTYAACLMSLHVALPDLGHLRITNQPAFFPTAAVGYWRVLRGGKCIMRMQTLSCTAAEALVFLCILPQFRIILRR